MFDIGDRVVYPMHGAGIIEAIEEKKILGENRLYYVMRIPYGDMKIMIPCDCCDTVGVREVINESELNHVANILSEDSTEMPGNWNRRYRDNMDKLRTGELPLTCEVVRNLMRVDRLRKLSAGEKKLLSNAKQILVSELILACGKNVDEVTILIEESVFGS